MRIGIRSLVGILTLIICLPPALYARHRAWAAPNLAFMKVRLNSPVKFSRLKSGDMLRGRVMQNAFSGYRVIIPTGSYVDLEVARMKRGAKKPNNLWPWPVQYFLPKYEKLPAFDFAEVSLPDGRKIRVHVATVADVDATHVDANTKAGIKSVSKITSSVSQTRPTDKDRITPDPILELVINEVRTENIGRSTGTLLPARTCGGVPQTALKTLSAGGHAKVALLSPLSASKSRAGDPFKALLEEPLRLDSGGILPEGTVFEGHVTKSVPPRWLSRPGTLYVTFTKLVIPRRSGLAMAASVEGVDVSRHSPIRMNSEGGMSGGSPGKVRLLTELGVGVGISKVADDTYQLIAEAFISTATDASTAGTARLIGFAFSGLYLLTRHGHDVTLPRYTTITIRFDRPPSLPLPENHYQSETVHRDFVRASKD